MDRSPFSYQSTQVGVKVYSAVEDRSVHFHLLHAKDRAPVEQHIIRKDTGKEVDKDDRRKAFALSRNTAVILQPEDLATLVPPEFLRTVVLPTQRVSRRPAEASKGRRE